MSQAPAKKRSWLSYRARVVLFLIFIAALVVLTLLYAPHERDASNVMGDALPITVTVTNPLGTLAVNHSIDIQQVQIIVTSVTQAQAFSDDIKRTGNYTLRVQLTAQSTSAQKGPVGIDYPTLARLRLPDGELIAPKLVSMSPIVLPRATVTGYIDFPLAAPQPLSGMALALGNGATVVFS